MTRLAAVLWLVSAVQVASADELRIARFDAQRVFQECQQSKEIEAAKDNQRGDRAPETPAATRWFKLKDQVVALTEQVKRAREDAPERERLELQLKLATLTLEVEQLHRQFELEELEKKQAAERLRERSEILGAIWGAASRLGAERNYRIVVPDRLPSDGLFFTIPVSGATDDLTDAILARVNEEYVAKKLK